MESEATNQTQNRLSDEDISRISQAVSGCVSESRDVVLSRLDSVDFEVRSAVYEVVPSAVASVMDSRSGVEVVSLTPEQWESLVSFNSYARDSYALQNTLLFFVLFFAAGLMGMRFFSEFVRGFRRA